ncbi:MAG: hypothetical protein ACAI35_16380 [Candidatus Methylacidiphilales bacterium]|nr:hypothetical protein [Candidatus Methylacidiphilales bacterium]
MLSILLPAAMRRGRGSVLSGVRQFVSFVALVSVILHFQQGASLAQASSSSVQNAKLPGNRSLNQAKPTAPEAPETKEQAQEKSTSPDKTQDKDKDKDSKKPAAAAKAADKTAPKSQDKEKDKEKAAAATANMPVPANNRKAMPAPVPAPTSKPSPAVAKERSKKANPPRTEHPAKSPEPSPAPTDKTASGEDPMGPVMSDITEEPKDTKPYQPARSPEEEMLPTPLNTSGSGAPTPLEVGPERTDEVVGPMPEAPAGIAPARETETPDPAPGPGGVPGERQLSRAELEVKIRQLEKENIALRKEAARKEQLYIEQKTINAVLGIDALTGDIGRIGERLLDAVAQLRQADRQRKEMAAALSRVLESSQSVLQSASGANGTLRAEYEVAVRQAQEVLAGRGGSKVPLASSLSDIQVIHVDLDRGSVILNAGRSLGIKEGTPFLIFRNAVRIARVKAFYVVDKASTGMIDTGGQRMDVAAGDRARIETDQISP